MAWFFRENLQESPIFHGKIDGFRCRFSRKNQSIEDLCRRNGGHFCGCSGFASSTPISCAGFFDKKHVDTKSSWFYHHGETLHFPRYCHQIVFRCFSTLPRISADWLFVRRLAMAMGYWCQKPHEVQREAPGGSSQLGSVISPSAHRSPWIWALHLPSSTSMEGRESPSAASVPKCWRKSGLGKS